MNWAIWPQKEITTERKKILLICQLKVAYPSHEYYRDIKQTENVRTLVTKRDMTLMPHWRDRRERFIITYSNKGTSGNILRIPSGLKTTWHQEYGKPIQEPNQEYETKTDNSD